MHTATGSSLLNIDCAVTDIKNNIIIWAHCICPPKIVDDVFYGFRHSLSFHKGSSKVNLTLSLDYNIKTQY